MNGIKPFTIEEGNIAASKCLDDFGGPNMWRLYMKTVKGYWESVQWMSVGNIQIFFKTTLPVYEEQSKQSKYKLAKQ